MPDKDMGTASLANVPSHAAAGHDPTHIHLAEADAHGAPNSATPITVDTGQGNFDDRPTASLTEDEWKSLESHMAAYFGAHIDILADKAHDLFGGERFVGLWKFASKYRYGLDKKFPYPADQVVRDQIDALFDGLRRTARSLFQGRLILLLGLLSLLFWATATFYPPSPAVNPAPGAQTTITAPTGESTAAAPSESNIKLGETAGGTMNTSDLYPGALVLIAVFYALFWAGGLNISKRRNHQLYATFQSQYQIGAVARMFDRYNRTHDLIQSTRLRPPHTPTPEAQRLVKQIERFAALMVWIAKRVEYYEKRMEVDHWRLLAHHFVLNVTYYAFLVVLLAAYVGSLNAFTDTAATLAMAPQVKVVWLATGLGAFLTFLPFVLGFFESFGAGGQKEFEDGLGIKTWIRYATFNLHQGIAKVVGDQVRRIHQEEDRPR